MKKGKFCIIDAMHLCYRNKYVFLDAKTSKGVQTGAIFGVIRSFKLFQEKYPKHEFVFCWDSKQNKRKKLDKLYKANREKPDWYAEFLKEIVVIKLILKSLGIKQYYLKGYEADDIAAHLVKRYERNVIDDSECILITGDNDWFQLVNDETGVSVYDPRVDIKYNEKMVYEKYKIDKPVNIVMYKVFKGDTSDNITGVKYIKTELVVNIVNRYKNMKQFFSLLDKDEEIPEKWKVKILALKDRLYLNEKVINPLLINRPIGVIIGKIDNKLLMLIYKKYELTEFRNEMIKNKLRGKKL